MTDDGKIKKSSEDYLLFLLAICGKFYIFADK